MLRPQIQRLILQGSVLILLPLCLWGSSLTCDPLLERLQKAFLEGRSSSMQTLPKDGHYLGVLALGVNGQKTLLIMPFFGSHKNMLDEFSLTETQGFLWMGEIKIEDEKITQANETSGSFVEYKEFKYDKDYKVFENKVSSLQNFLEDTYPHLVDSSSEFKAFKESPTHLIQEMNQSEENLRHEIGNWIHALMNNRVGLANSRQTNPNTLFERDRFRKNIDRIIGALPSIISEPSTPEESRPRLKELQRILLQLKANQSLSQEEWKKFDQGLEDLIEKDLRGMSHYIFRLSTPAGVAPTP